MTRILYTYTLLVASATLVSSDRRRPHGLRVLYGVRDIDNKYGFVVALVSECCRLCTGTFISPQWVLTAAHCIETSPNMYEDNVLAHIQYGDMTKYPNSTLTKAAIIERYSHPGYRKEYISNDIALLLVMPTPLPAFGRISAVDYSSLIGRTVEYAGYGITEYDDDPNNLPLVIGEGVVRSCSDDQEKYKLRSIYLCVAPKCSNDEADSAGGDSGGPLFYDQEIVGVVSAGGSPPPIGWYTPVSPYITWIRQVMISNTPISRKHIQIQKEFY